MRLKNIFTYILLLVAISFAASDTMAQNRSATIDGKESSDSISLYRGIAVSIDAAGAVQRAVSSYGQYEAALRINLKDRYFPVVEIGIGDADNTDDATSLRFKTSAPYFKAGCDFNILKNKHDDYRAYVGVRYAFTSFKYDVEGQSVNDPIWGGEAIYAAYDVKGSSHWAELITGVDAKIVGPFRLGWSFRYRSRISQKHGDIGEAWYVPGYGKKGSSRLGATFNLILEI